MYCLYIVIFFKWLGYSKDEKQHARRLLEIIYKQLNDSDKKIFLTELKQSDVIKLQNPTDCLNSFHTQVSFIKGYIILESRDFSEFLYKEVNNLGNVDA